LRRNVTLKFKLLRTTVDVLTLSATPIPRTLYMALTGARDLSTLETPPQDRLPVETVVGNYDERVIRDALRRELNRGGQVYFLHNRVSTIESVALKLKALVPDARIVVGHGQMDADDLEKVMTQFVNGEADVLVSTTIIESGLDIPNANTMVIDRADRFGLLPTSVELLVSVHELRVLAAAKQVTAVEVAEDKVKLFRGREPITIGGYFPRLAKREAKARMAELRKLLLGL
jgi:transcription-repair coupling factor (superfamily II helicase)